MDPSAALLNLARRYGAIALYAFGSRAAEALGKVRGQAAATEHPDSDVDIGVQLPRGVALSVRDKVDLAAALEEILGVARVDLVVLHEAPPFLALDIVRGELLACTDPDEQSRYELYVLRRAGDLAPYQRERLRMILEDGGA